MFLLSLLAEILQLTVDTKRQISQISSRYPNPSAAGWSNTPHAVDPKDLSERCLQGQEGAVTPLLTALPIGIEVPHLPSLHRVTL